MLALLRFLRWFFPIRLKQLTSFIQAAKEVENIKLYVIAGGDPAEQQDTLLFISRLPIYKFILTEVSFRRDDGRVILFEQNHFNESGGDPDEVAKILSSKIKVLLPQAEILIIDSFDGVATVCI